LSVVLCESLQFAKVAHVFEMAKNTGESSASTLEANLVRSFEIAASECDRVALSRKGNAIVTYSNTSFSGGARGQANATCHYGEHFHKSMVLKESVASVCRSLRSTIASWRSIHRGACGRFRHRIRKNTRHRRKRRLRSRLRVP